MQTISKSLIGVAIVTITMITGDVMAQPPGDGGGGRRGGGGAPSATDFLERYDTDKDGKLTKEELPERMQRIVERADADKNGSISKDELEKMFAQRGGQARGGRERGGPGGEREGRGAPGGERGGRGGADFMKTLMQRMPIIAALDADQDGEISEAEINNAVAALKKLDKNGDGKLAGDEIVPAPPEFGGRGGRGGGEFGGRGGRGGGGGGGGGGRGGDRGGDRPQRPSRPE